MNRYEQVGVGEVCASSALRQRNEIVAFARELRAHAASLQGIDEATGNAERDVLLEDAAGRPGARIIAAVAGIDRDEWIPRQRIDDRSRALGRRSPNDHRPGVRDLGSL